MDIMALLGQYVFPVVACIAMAWYVKDQGDKNREQLDKIMEAHKTEIKEITTALNNNTLALQRLTDFMKEDR